METATSTTFQDYLSQLPEDRRKPIEKLREIILTNLPSGFEEQIGEKFVNYVVPYSLYPKGYHCEPKQPLPFISIASQKNFIALYHMGIYAEKGLSEWFISEYPKHSKNKLDMGKSCIRFKNMSQIPYALIEELVSKMSPEVWIKHYEESFLKKV